MLKLSKYVSKSVGYLRNFSRSAFLLPRRDFSVVKPESKLKETIEPDNQASNQSTDVLRNFVGPKRYEWAEQQARIEQKIKDEELKTAHTTKKVLDRELFNDVFQLISKFTAYCLASASYLIAFKSKGTFFAELTRTVIDCFHHILLYNSTKINTGPTHSFYYGIYKIKNMIAFIPACLFLYYGIENINYAFLEYSGVPEELDDEDEEDEDEDDEGFIWEPVLCYVASFIFECSVIWRNVYDSSKLVGASSKLTPWERIKYLYKNKSDPIIQVILSENMLTILSTVIPLIFPAIGFVLATRLAEPTGTALIGLLELYAGWHLGKQNAMELSRESVEEQTMKSINEITLSNPYIKEVQNSRTMIVGPGRFIYAAQITFDMEKIRADIVEEFREEIINCIYHKTPKARSDQLLWLFEEIHEEVFERVQMETNAIEKKITDKYPQCAHIDLEIDHNHLFSDLEVDENALRQTTFETLRANPQNILDNPDITNMIDKFLPAEDLDPTNIKKDMSHKRANNVNFSMDVNYDEIEESLILVDNEKKYSILQDSLTKM